MFVPSGSNMYWKWFFFKCQRCSKKFANKPSLLVHMKHFHPELRESCHKHSKRTHKCEHCVKIYKRTDFLAMHVAKIHKNSKKRQMRSEKNVRTRLEKNKKNSNASFARSGLHRRFILINTRKLFMRNDMLATVVFAVNSLRRRAN